MTRWNDMIRAFGRIGLMSFGGPAAQIAVMHDELVDRRKWLSEDDFLGALSFCMLLPGPEAMQLSTYAGWRMRGVTGGLLAGLLFVIPGALVIAALAFAYAAWGDLPLIREGFLGFKAVVIAIVFGALWRVSQKALSTRAAWVTAILAFIAIFALNLPFPLIILAAGLFGFFSAQSIQAAQTQRTSSWYQTARTAAIWMTLWAVPLIPLILLQADFLLSLALFFAKLAVVTFGGAYAVLAYMTQEVVQTHGWLTASQMIDALGLAETTPGPLILVTQFTGHLAGIAQGGWTLGLTAGLLTLWMTFVPCFLWIFAFAPHVQALLSNPRLKGALSAITAAVVGVILNLSVWFNLHVLFHAFSDTSPLPIPDFGSFDIKAAVLTLIALVAILGFKSKILPSLGALAGLSILIGSNFGF